jgi:uncharacterized protein YndB with AHSA1/START domain
VTAKVRKFSTQSTIGLAFAQNFVSFAYNAIAEVSMEKHKFVTEYEFRASPRMLFPYVSTASGLAQWFAAKVNNLPDHQFDFQWDNESHLAKQTVLRQHKNTRFEFLNTSENGQDNNYVDFKVEQSELTQATFLRITDYSANTDEDELQEIWDGLLDKLKAIVGG